MHNHDEFKVGPDGKGSYRYRFGQMVSVPFANAQSATEAARRPQEATADGLRPVPETT